MNAEAETEQVAPPPPEETCAGCSKNFEYTLRPDWQRHLGMFRASPRLFSGICYERIEHPECQEANDRRQAERQAEGEREQREAHFEREREERKQEFDHWYASKTLPLDVLEKTFETYEADESNANSVSLMRKWREGDDFGFLLYGPSGTGKSHLGFALIRTVLEKHLLRSQPYQSWKDFGTVRDRMLLPHYESVASMLSSLRGTSGELTYMQANSPILFLDDLGAESITEWSREIFFRLFEHRLNRRLPVIVTSNLTLNELKERMHERVVSRMLGLCVPLQIKGHDRRKGMLADRVKMLAGRPA